MPLTDSQIRPIGAAQGRPVPPGLGAGRMRQENGARHLQWHRAPRGQAGRIPLLSASQRVEWFSSEPVRRPTGKVPTCLPAIPRAGRVVTPNPAPYPFEENRRGAVQCESSNTGESYKRKVTPSPRNLFGRAGSPRIDERPPVPAPRAGPPGHVRGLSDTAFPPSWSRRERCRFRRGPRPGRTAA